MTNELRTQIRELLAEIVVLRQQVAQLTASAEEASSAKSIIGIAGDLRTHVVELVNYGRMCRDAMRSLETLIQHLRACSDPEAKAIGNSLDAMFRSVPPPQALR